MSRRIRILGIAAVIAVLAGIAVGAVALAQDSTDTTTTAPDWIERYREALAGALGITVEEFDAAVAKARDQVVSDAVTEGWLTDDQAEMLRWRLSQEPQANLKRFGVPGLGKGMGIGMGRGLGGFTNTLISIVSDKLDMTIGDLLTELSGGKTIADLAGEKGVDTQVIVDAYLEKCKEKLDASVADGDITQKQADLKLEQAKTMVTEQLTRKWQSGPGFGGRGGRGHGRWGMMAAPDIEESGEQ